MKSLRTKSELQEYQCEDQNSSHRYGNGKDSFGQLNNGLAKMSTPSSPEPKNVILHDRRDSAEVIRVRSLV